MLIYIYTYADTLLKSYNDIFEQGLYVRTDAAFVLIAYLP